MDKRREIKIGSFLSYLQIGISVIIGVVLTPISLRALGKAEYGLYNSVISVVSMFTLLSLGFNSGYIRFFSNYKKNNDQKSINTLNGMFLLIFSVIGTVSLVLGIVLSLNAKIVFSDGLTEDELKLSKILLLILTVSMSISFPMSVFQNIIVANEKFLFLKVVAIFKTVFSPALSVVLLLLGFRSVALVITTSAVNLTADLLYLFYVKFRLKCGFCFREFDSKILKHLFVYTSFVAIHLVVDQVNMNLDKFLIARFKGTEEAAIYTVGFSLYSHFLTIGLAIVPMFTPLVHQIVQRNNENKHKELSNVFIKVGRIQFVVVMLVASGLVIFGKQFISIWAGEGFENSYYVAILLVLSGSIDLIQNLGIEIQRALELHKFRAIAYIIGALFNLILTIFLCQKYGAVGSAVGTAISLVAVQGICINFYYSKKCHLNIARFWINILRMLVGIIPPILLGVFIVNYVDTYRVVNLILSILVYSMAFCVSMWFLSLNKQEKESILSTVKRCFFCVFHKKRFNNR